MKERTVSPVFCETCGGPLEYEGDGTHARCPYCGNNYNFGGGMNYSLSLALSRAGAMRLGCDFEGAALEYKLITDRNPDCAEAWWGLALCNYGVEYIPSAEGGRLPTFRKLLKTGILADEYYQRAVACAADEQAQSYRAKAEEIERLQSEAAARMQWGRRCDVFICCRRGREEDEAARRLYGVLTGRGLNVFCPEYSLKGLAERDYEPEVFAALYRCRYFILISFGGDDARVKNQYTRFGERLYAERLYNACCAIYSGDGARLPPFVRGNAVRAEDYPAGGCEEQVADNIAAILGHGAYRKEVSDSAGKASGEALNDILLEGRLALEGGSFVRAAAAYSRAIELDGDCGEAWLGALLAELEVKKLTNSKKFAQELCNKLWASGTTVAECDGRLAANEHIVYALSSPYYKNAAKYATSAAARILSEARVKVVEMADKCNAALKLCRRDCINAAARAQGGTYARKMRREPGLDEAAISAIAGAAAGSLIGGFLGRRMRREPRLRFRPRGPWRRR